MNPKNPGRHNRPLLKPETPPTPKPVEPGPGVANAPKSISTGRTVPNNLNENLAMEEVMANPGGNQLPIKMTDTKNNLLAQDGRVKMTQNVNGVEIHYVTNLKTGQVVDFKFKE